jgi:hypothetical protein
MSGLARHAALVVLVLLVPCLEARAQKVDVVRLRNGDRITCEITGLTRSVLNVSTDPLGSISIHWGQIVGIESPRAFTLQLTSGERYYGSLVAGPADQIVVGFGGGGSVALAISDIVQLVPIGQSFWRRIDGSLDVGFSFAQANLETHGTLNGSATYRTQTRQISAKVSSQVSTREDADREYRADLGLSYIRYLSNRWYGIGWAGGQQNDELTLELRVLAGGGIGRELVHTDRRIWSLFGGAAYTRELYFNEPLEQSTEAAIGGQLDFFAPANDDYNITNRLITYINIGGRRRLRAELQSAWRQEFLADFYWSLNGFESFDSDPPPEEKQNDFGVSFTIGWKF